MKLLSLVARWTSALRQSSGYLFIQAMALALFLFAFSRSGMAQASGAVLVSVIPELDGLPYTIRKFSLTGEPLGIFASTGLNQPLDLVVDRAGNVYAANMSDGTIARFSPSGANLGIFAIVHEPIALAFDAAGNLFVSDIFDNTIHEFSPTGQDLGVIVSLLGFGCPGDLVVNRAGNLLVADPCSNVVREFSTTGASIGIFASTGLSNPLGVALDGTGDLFVSNTSGAFQNTIRKFSAAGQDLGVFAATGLAFAARIDVDIDGNVFAANMQQLSIRKFSPAGQDLGDFAVLPSQPLALVITKPAPVFAGTAGAPNCHGKSVSALTGEFGGLAAAATALGYSSVQALQEAIRVFCR
jgi:DNA-binding beta-propeller fold protein YncE